MTTKHLKGKLLKYENEKEFVTRLKIYCKKKLPSFKVPVKVNIDNEIQFTDRFKKKRVKF